jgi:ribosomal protein L37E
VATGASTITKHHRRNTRVCRRMGRQSFTHIPVKAPTICV